MEKSEPVSQGVKPGFALWFTGLPASGKTAVARALREKLRAPGVACVIIDSDEMRRIMTPNPTYTPEERDWFYNALAQLAEWLTNSGVNVLIAATANRRAYRDAARQKIPRFAEIHVTCSPDVCRSRDPKGLYALAAAGKIAQLPGAGTDYEPPLHPDAIITTDYLTPEEAALSVLKQLDRFLNK